MRNLKRRFERFTAIALAVLMVVTTVDLSTFAVSAAGEGSGTYCEHHTEHTPECGYTEGIEGSPCAHEHGEECYSEVTVCVHGHDESCGYVEGVEDSCTHICSLENGCIISALNCTHEHDEACGYQAAVEGTPCIFECEECANDGSDTVSGNEVSEETTECTCETDDPAFHATNCPAYIAPENPECFCAEKCTDDTLNVWCDVCGVQGVSACQGEDTAVAYANGVASITNGETVTNYATFADALANWTDGTTLTLLADVTLTERIKTYAKGLSLDLNGHKIECSDTQFTIWIDGDSGSELTIRDSNGGGYIQGVVYAVVGGSKLYLESGTVEAVNANGDFTMTGGRIISEDGIGLYVNAKVDVVISGGEIYGSNYGVWNRLGNVIISGDTKITGAGQYAIRSNTSTEVVISGTPTISGGAGEFILDSKITLNTQPANGEVWRVKINTEEITDGIFAVPGEDIVLDASKFASAMDEYDVKQNAKGELLLCNHQTAYAAVSNEDGSTHKMLCCCRETTVEESVACSGFGATCQTKAVCAACGQSYGETNPDVHTFNDDGKCVCGAERDAATTVDLSSLTATYVISDSGEYIFTGTGSYGIKVESGNPKIVLNNVNISLTDGDYYEKNPINGIHIATTGGTTEILVLGESSITAKAGAGIFVAEGGTVKITGSSREDILIATGASGCSGIGGYVYYTNGSVNCGNIEISNVTVKAFGSVSSMGDSTPAIGGAGNGNCGYITIDNADVYAEGFINPYGYEGSSAIGTGVGWGNREGGTIGEISIINDSKVYVTRGNYCDYIGCTGSEDEPAEGVVDATAKSSTIYCYDSTGTTEPIQTLKYGALGGLLKEDGTCEGEHTGIICDNCGYCSCTHEGVEPTYALTEDGSRHTATWSCCGYEVTEEHSWNCEPDEANTNKMTFSCTIDGCTKGGTITVTGPEGAIYDGNNHTATVTVETKENEELIETPVITYDSLTEGVELVDGKPVNAGTYQANVSFEGVLSYQEFEIKKATPNIGTVSAESMKNTLDISNVVLSRTDGTISGTLSLKEGTELAYGIHDYTYVFKSGDANYNDVEGTVSITITDTNPPTATYKVGTDDWKQFINTFTFGHFCKDYTTVDIIYSDEGSGLADTQYCISDVEITNTANIQWSEYTGTLNINATGKYYIYVRVTDNDGNVVIQNSEGIVVYAESVITPTSFSREYGAENSLYVTISTNGNTFANLTDGSGNEIDTENYSIDGNELTIKGEYLSDLDVGEYTYKICMNPQGVENTEVTLAYSFVVNVTAKELTVTGATATSRAYIANDKTVDITGVTLSGIQGTDDVSVEITGLKGTLSSANAGTYTSVTLPTLTLPTFTLTGDDAENYVLVQPTSAVATNVTINKLNPTITVGETEYYKTFGDADFTLDITDDNPEANVTYSSNDENVVTVSNGTVTINGAGSTTITVSMGASTNYNAAVDKTVTVNVARATYSVDTINKSYLYARSNADSINLAELLPEDCGTVNYASVTYNGALRFTSEDTKPKVTNGILAYTLESGAADDTGNIIVDVETQNYEDITITVNVTLIDQIPVNVDGEVELNSNVLTYGETLSGLTFKSVDFVDNAGNEVAGTLAWKEPSATPNAGTTSAKWVFTPNNAEYASVEGTVAITVNKATPNVTGVPTVADRVYNPSVVLADSDLTGGTVKGVDGNSLAGSWSWQSTNVVPVVNNSGYIAVFTPTDSTNYETVTRTITVNVTKATPYVATKPTASALTYGQTLNQSVLSNGVIHYSETDSTVVAGSFAWETGTVKPAVSDSATTLYNVLFTPDDSDNYKEVTVKLTVSVSKAEATALNNANKTYVYAESKNGESVSIEGLPEDCGSVSYEISSISDTNNMLENVSVDATGKLTYDVKSLNAYSNGLSATVTVTVSMQNYEDLTYTLTVVRTDKLVQNISAENISLTFGDNDTDIVVTGNKTELSYRVVDDSNENGDVVTVDSTGKVHIVNSGTATVEIKAEGSSSYAEAICEIQVAVAKRTVNVPAKDDTVYTYTGLPQTYSIASSPFYTIENTTQTNAGTYDVAVSLISDNYQWSAVLPEYKFVIKPAQVTITAESHTVKQGDELPAFTYITTGLVNGENLPITVGVSCSATNSETVGTYDIVVSGPANEGNYTYTYKKGTLEVLAEDNAPFIKGDDGKMGWDAIRDAIEAANKGDTIVVDMNGATVVPGDIIELVRDKGVIISFEFDNGLTWTIDGSTVSDGEIGNINFDTTVEDENNSLNNIPIDVINNITGEKGTIEIYLVHSGEFGFTAVLKANLGSDNAGYYANLYYYNPTTGKLEYMCADVIASNGEAELTFTHASDYVVVIDDEDLGKKTPDDDDDDDDNGGGNNNNNNTSDTGNTKKEDEKDEVPDTGDAGTLYLWIMMVCAALGMAGVACYERLQKRNKK